MPSGGEGPGRLPPSETHCSLVSQGPRCLNHIAITVAIMCKLISYSSHYISYKCNGLRFPQSCQSWGWKGGILVLQDRLA